ncbi:hypothetical protein AAY86_01125 [Pseudomonas amygdali pv. tabaci str. ATCC 11528]|nr:hypothetical protein AAY86_01125 [Pseudomonas amygdali pv. tabaci str. ATCC 11528]KPY75807.1 transposase protein [Pseudomonas amygdali pv. tabaci]
MRSDCLAGWCGCAAFLNVDLFRCVLCGARMVYTAALSGLTVQGLILNAQAITQMRYVKP